MSLDELDLILKKDPIISTWPAQSLADDPLRVQNDYLIHAKSHVPLGDTTRYVDNLFRWVSGANKGTFIGAVLGDYGEGKTSFLVHVWAESSERRVLAVPPFQWRAFEQIIDAIAGWLLFLLQDQRPDLAAQVKRLQAAFHQQTAESLAQEMIEREGGDYESALVTIKSLIASSSVHVTAMSASRVLDFCARASEIVSDAGYEGLLVLLDEPEKAADALGIQAVHLFLFDLADELLRRQGNYGFFVSLPRNFHASAVTRFPALTARLEGRGCFPSLSALYGPGFARDLWNRYAQAFELGPVAERVVSPLALEAIGQVGSSERKDLSYGPRSVISAFRRMVDHWRRTGEAYSPRQFVQDALDQEITLPDGYRSRVQTALRSPEIDDHNRDAVTLLAAFPGGLRIEVLDELGLTEVLRPLARANGPVYRSALIMGLRALLPETASAGSDPLREQIEEIDAAYAPDLRTFERALAGFCRDLVPMVFREREGQQLEGWQYIKPLAAANSQLWIGALQGAFPQASRWYPQRAAILVVSGLGARAKGVTVPRLPEDSGPLCYDLQFSLVLRWNRELGELTQGTRIVDRGDGPILIQVLLDLTEGLVVQDGLAEMVGADRLTPLWVLNLLQGMQEVQLPKEQEVIWKNLRDELQRKLVGLLFGTKFADGLAHEAQSVFGERPVGRGLDLLGHVSLLALKHRYPDYETLIRQPRWQGRVDAYISALGSAEVPLAAKRGREPWRPEDSVAARVLGANRMNLTGGAYAGYESLITVESRGRSAPLEVSFRVHPLEDEIRRTICSQEMGAGRKFRHEGKECWYLPLEDLFEIVKQKGYTVEELGKIIEIGKARGSYALGRMGREDVLYCMPLDPDELKAQLRAKLDELILEIREYKKLPDYVTSLDEERVRQEINAIEDDADYEQLLLRLNREFQANHQRLPGYFDRVQERLRGARNVLAGLQGQITGSRDVARLQVPAARSKWREALERLIIPNLQDTGDDLRSELRSALEQADRAITRYVHSQGKSPADNLVLLLEGLTEASALEATQSRLVDAVRSWLMHVSELNQWSGLLRTDSDPLYERLLELRLDEAHRGKGDELLARFDQVAERIKDHILRRNVTGLGAYQQFREEFQAIETARQDYLSTLKASFDVQKGRVNSLLERAKLDGRVNVVFNPAAISDCYEQLYRAGVKTILETGCAQILREIENQVRDLRYARDILKAVSAEDAAALSSALEQVRAKTVALAGQVTDQWLRHLCEEWSDSDVEAIVTYFDQAFDVVREARRKAGEVGRPDPPEAGEAHELYAVLPSTGQADLKELVLKAMERRPDPSSALETSLEALAELFRRNAVQISVSRRSR